MSVGDFKSKFSEVVDKLLAGEEVGISYGKKKAPIGVIVPYKSYKKNKKVKLGIWKGKGSFSISKDFKMTEEEFLNLKE